MARACVFNVVLRSRAQSLALFVTESRFASFESRPNSKDTIRKHMDRGLILEDLFAVCVGGPPQEIHDLFNPLPPSSLVLSSLPEISP